jgi:transcriptional regulator with XRE-family HTH domain
MECSPGPGECMQSRSQVLLRTAIRPTRASARDWLRKLRKRRGLSQRELAQKVGVEHYSIIAQLEAGHGHIPADRYAVWARALGIEPDQFIRCLDANAFQRNGAAVKLNR